MPQYLFPAPEALLQGFTIIDADAIARTVVDRGRWGYRRVLGAFGSGILRSDGEPANVLVCCCKQRSVAAVQSTSPSAHPSFPTPRRD